MDWVPATSFDYFLYVFNSTCLLYLLYLDNNMYYIAKSMKLMTWERWYGLYRMDQSIMNCTDLYMMNNLRSSLSHIFYYSSFSYYVRFTYVYSLYFIVSSFFFSLSFIICSPYIFVCGVSLIFYETTSVRQGLLVMYSSHYLNFSTIRFSTYYLDITLLHYYAHFYLYVSDFFISLLPKINAL